MLVEGAPPLGDEARQQLNKLLPVLVDELPVKQAAKIASKVTGLHRNDIYRQALDLKQKNK
jgi:16S rRNA (cytidine1402-2'-O)-methyltransferase